ncbi:MAG: CvpA family protein [Spirochaetales bacterium]|nr:CvpA family protein [Spirochaetales bacterium]
MNFTTIDIIFLIIMGIMAVRGLFRGLISELFSFGALVVGLLVAMAFSGKVAVFFSEQFGEQSWNRGLAFFIVFILIYIALQIIERIIVKMMDETAAFSVDKGLGLLLGLFEGIIICSLLTYLLDIQTVFNTDQLLGGSFIVPYLVKVFPFLESTGAALMDNFRK